ncbi:class I SAM-dependent methyltransferase [Caulobacter sp. KR2-114]|uniref:class I SAM-dependent methyltransferase n=1 Tax=Caulobacter sp. KR2-114 TaxID=3400912 RepID=UPI003C0187F0
MTDAAVLSRTAAVYGAPPPALAAPAAGAVQVSPLSPGATALEAIDDGSLESLVMLAPPGTVERRYALAQALRALKVGGRLTALAPKDKGGSRLGKELQAFGCAVGETARKHHRICVVARPPQPQGLDAAIAEGGPRQLGGLWTQPGVFSWDRIDPGTALLAETLPSLSGAGADFGCGIGILGLKVLAAPAVSRLALLDIDRRAVEAAQRNVTDPRADIRWADVRGAHGAQAGLADLDFVVMNPPFHDGGAEDKALGQGFIRAARAALRKGGVLWMVANRHLPYEAVLAEAFAKVTPHADRGGFKVLEARA